jgi:hypothetical protein
VRPEFCDHPPRDLLTALDGLAEDEIAVRTGSANVNVATVRARAQSLAAALNAITVERDTDVLLMCCETHVEDFLVGLLAVQLLGATAVIARPADQSDLELITRRSRNSAVLACSDDWPRWQAAGVPGIAVADGPGAYWWPMLERQHASETFHARPPAHPAVRLVSFRQGSPMRVRELSADDLAALAVPLTDPSPLRMPVGNRVRARLTRGRMWTGHDAIGVSSPSSISTREMKTSCAG